MNSLRKSILFFCLLLAILIGGIDVLLTTEWGFRQIFKFAQQYLPGNLKIASVQGSLNKQISLQNIYYKNVDFVFSAKLLKISLQPLMLLTHGNLIINSITLDSADVVYKSHLQEKNAKQVDWQTLIRKLSLIKIKNANLQRININYNDKRILLNQLLIRKFQQQTHFALNSNVGTITGTLNLSRDKNVTWMLTARGTGLNANFINPDISTNITFKIRTIGVLKNNKLTSKAWLQQLGGSIRHYPLQGTGYFAYNEGNILFKNFQLSIANAHLSVNGSLLQKVGEMTWAVAVPNLNEVLPRASGSIQSEGVLKTADKVFGMNAFISAKNLILPSLKINQVNANVQSSQFMAANVNAKFTGIQFKAYQIQQVALKDTVNYINKNINQHFQILINNQNRIFGALDLPNFMQQGIDQQVLQANVQIPNIKASTLYQNKNFPITDGIVHAQLKIAGTVSQPSVTGLAQFQQGKLHLNNLGITLNNIQMSANLNNYQPIVIRGSLNSGTGQATIQGAVDFYNKAIPDLHLNITGQNFQAMNLKEYKLAISPQIALDNQAGILNISGAVSIPYLSVVTDHDIAIALPSEVTFIGRPNVKPSIPSQLKLKLQVTFSNNVYIAYKKLHANIVGQINVLQVPGGLPTGFGELNIEKGEYRVYNHLLKVSNGRLIYVGNSLYNPGLNIEALEPVKNTNIISSWLSSWFPKIAPDTTANILVGASVKGTLNDPDITLISYPAMNQQDILSYLLTGSGSDSFGGSSSFSTIGALASGLNLFSNGEDGDDSSGSALGGVGSLAGGLFNSIQALNFRLPLTKNLDLQTETNWNETGIDLNYLKEYD